MYRIYGLNMTYFLQLVRQRLAQPVVVDCDEGFTFLADQLQKPIIVCAAQNRDFIQFSPVQLLVVVEESINLYAILPKDLKSHTTKVVGAEDENWVLHWI